MILCPYKMYVCVDAVTVRLCILQSFVFPKLIILFTITKVSFLLTQTRFQHGSGVNCVYVPLVVTFVHFEFVFFASGCFKFSELRLGPGGPVYCDLAVI